MIYYALILPDKLNEEVIKIEQREVLNGEYINVDGKDYVLLQIKYLMIVIKGVPREHLLGGKI